MTLQEIEDTFQKIQEHYLEYKDLESWHKMYFYINNCVGNIIKSKIKGLVLRDLDGMITDATLSIMNRYKKSEKFRIEKLSSYCYTPCLYPLYNDKKKFNDKILSLNAYLEDTFIEEGKEDETI